MTKVAVAVAAAVDERPNAITCSAAVLCNYTYIICANEMPRLENEKNASK